MRQMLKKVRIEEAGDTEFLPGTNVDRLIFEDVNNELEKEGNDCLRKVCRPVEKFDERLAILLDDMAQKMYEGNGVEMCIRDRF